MNNLSYLFYNIPKNGSIFQKQSQIIKYFNYIFQVDKNIQLDNLPENANTYSHLLFKEVLGNHFRIIDFTHRYEPTISRATIYVAYIC